MLNKAFEEIESRLGEIVDNPPYIGQSGIKIDFGLRCTMISGAPRFDKLEHSHAAFINSTCSGGGNMPPGRTRNQLLIRSHTALMSVCGWIGHSPIDDRH